MGNLGFISSKYYLKKIMTFEFVARDREKFIICRKTILSSSLVKAQYSYFMDEPRSKVKSPSNPANPVGLFLNDLIWNPANYSYINKMGLLVPSSWQSKYFLFSELRPSSRLSCKRPRRSRGSKRKKWKWWWLRGSRRFRSRNRRYWGGKRSWSPVWTDLPRLRNIGKTCSGWEI